MALDVTRTDEMADNCDMADGPFRHRLNAGFIQRHISAGRLKIREAFGFTPLELAFATGLYPASFCSVLESNITHDYAFNSSVY